jgi:hypothetical protein
MRRLSGTIWRTKRTPTIPKGSSGQAAAGQPTRDFAKLKRGEKFRNATPLDFIELIDENACGPGVRHQKKS